MLIKLNGKKSLLAFSFCLSVFLISFVFPVSQMIYWTFKFPKYIQDLNILRINLNTLYLVSLASLVLVFISLFINYGSRISKSKILNYLTNFSISGYAIPGVILAVAFITLFSNLSDLINDNTNIGSTLFCKGLLFIVQEFIADDSSFDEWRIRHSLDMSLRFLASTNGFICFMIVFYLSPNVTQRIQI